MTDNRMEQTTIERIQKRDGTLVSFDLQKIAGAIKRAMLASGEIPLNLSEGVADALSHQEALAAEKAAKVAAKIETNLKKIAKRFQNFLPTVEGIQDAVEEALIEGNYAKTAKAYIIYRDKRTQLRAQSRSIPEHVQKLWQQSRQYFRHTLSEFVYLRTYARWIEGENRRESWVETVGRYIDFMRENLGNKLSEVEYDEIREMILTQQVMPSMRLLQFAGRAARATQVCAYNCSFIAPQALRDFSEVMYVLMCGTGVGFSVESQNIQALPQIQFQTGEMLPTHVIDDSKEGWCDALYLGMKCWFSGQDMRFDYSRLRPAGARLKTIGGKSSGPAPLRALLEFTRERIIQKQGRRLSNLDAHDILCKIGEIVVSGGVRRSAMISLSDLYDVEMRGAKKGTFYYAHPERSIANNSAVYETQPSNVELLDEWLALMQSGSGERGIFNRAGLLQTLPERRVNILKQDGLIANNRFIGILGTNPCGEIILRSKQFCNLSEIVARAEDDEASLLRKIKYATLLGTYQSTLTHFPYLSKAWQENCERERLLGVSITGQWDCQAVRNADMLTKLKAAAIHYNAIYAKRFGINTSTAITCVKPSGTVSQTVDCASGMHPRHAPYYIRRIRISATDSLFRLLKDQGIPYYPEVGQSEESATTFVLEFPVKAPEGAICKNDLTALEQLEHWKLVKENYTEHNPSVTISVGENEWIDVLHWVQQNWAIVGGLSFLPRSNHVYQLAPYEAIDEARYRELERIMEKIDFSQLYAYEKADETELKRELACVGGACEIE